MKGIKKHLMELLLALLVLWNATDVEILYSKVEKLEEIIASDHK